MFSKSGGMIEGRGLQMRDVIDVFAGGGGSGSPSWMNFNVIKGHEYESGCCCAYAGAG